MSADWAAFWALMFVLAVIILGWTAFLLWRELQKERVRRAFWASMASDPRRRE